MKQEIKERWLEALRSGEYEQGRRRLMNEDNGTFCCLGVLTDLYLKEVGSPWGKERDPSVRVKHDPTISTDSEFLPKIVRKWAGLRDNNRNPIVYRDGVRLTLSRLNDEGYDFQVIADLIEEQL